MGTGLFTSGVSKLEDGQRARISWSLLTGEELEDMVRGRLEKLLQSGSFLLYLWNNFNCG